MPQANTASHDVKLPPANDWRTTDQDEIEKRRLRALEESFRIRNLDPIHPIFSNFSVHSDSGMTYSVEIRDLRRREFACDCVDFRSNNLGTCKHVEAVLLHLQARFGRQFKSAQLNGSNRIEIILDPSKNAIRLLKGTDTIPAPVRRLFTQQDHLSIASAEDTVARLDHLRSTALPALRISQEVTPWLEEQRQAAERKELRRQYELKVQNGEWPTHETTVPLFPYQREGMLHLAFTERALLADEMGLGKTIQAIAACALLHRLGKAQRILVVTPASLKTEWEEQIRKFSTLPLKVVFGNRLKRLDAYSNPSCFTIVNYEQMVADALDVNQRLKPDVVVLDEAQRIKNWNTKTAQAVKRLRSRYAFVLTGTPIENRIDELHSLMDFLNPRVLGPLFRFNRDFYQLDDRGRPTGYRNLDQLHARIRPYLLRRRKADVETELPERTDRNHFVPMSDLQRQSYSAHEQEVMKLVNVASRRPLTLQEQEKLQRELAMMRMICDSNYILDPNDRTCPKLAELEKLIEECRDNDAKVIIFSEWQRMLELVRDTCKRLDVGYAWHTGSVPQQRRRAEINLFKDDPACRVFLSTDSGATGLNLQTASVVINCDLPWNPAKLEQRIARAWRKHQTKPVTVINLISENTIEHRMLDTLALKQSIADSVLDRPGEIKEFAIRGGRQAFLQKLKQLITPQNPSLSAPPPASAQNGRKLPTDPAIAFAQLARERINGALVRCEERFPLSGPHSVLVVVVDRNPADYREKLSGLHSDLFGPGKSDPLSPTQFEVIDSATDNAIQRLIAAGLISKTTRASRSLTDPDSTPTPETLSPEELAKIASLRQQASRKLKMARLLHDGELAEETRPALLEAALLIARALAVENRLPEPASLPDALTPPLSRLWTTTLEPLRSFLADANAPAGPLLDRLSTSR